MAADGYYRFAGLVVHISGDQPPQAADDRLPLFAISPQKPDIELSIQQVDDIPFPAQRKPEWEEAYLRSCIADGTVHRYFRRDIKPNGADYAHLSYALTAPQIRSLALCNRGFALTEKHILTCIGNEELFLSFGRAVLHSSCVCHKGQAVLFSGPSGIGKSTQAALWETYGGAEVMNGDRTLLWIRDNTVRACGLPYAGSSGICKSFELPISAIVFLEQATTNKLTRLTPPQAIRHLLSQLPVPRWSAAAIERAADIAAKVAELVPIYRLCCLPEQSAVYLLQNTLAKEQ